MGPNLFANFYETAAVILFGVGVTTMLLHRNLVKKIIGLNIMDTSIYLFLTAKGYITGHVAMMRADAIRDPALYVNPIPSALVLTGIVVSVSVTAFLLALAHDLYKHYRTLDFDRIILEMQREDD
jgi:multicomponent Na+:H+ antiporter subunit C